MPRKSDPGELDSAANTDERELRFENTTGGDSRTEGGDGGDEVAVGGAVGWGWGWTGFRLTVLGEVCPYVF